MFIAINICINKLPLHLLCQNNAFQLFLKGDGGIKITFKREFINSYPLCVLYIRL
nr:MAG TPA: hypothetical protein [Caudoviricetes sp.]